MPRITEPTVAEHVQKQEEAVIDAATRLFAERGFASVTIADIASEVGLARTSLYRYFPNKDHILLAWLHRETDRLIQRSEEVANDDVAPSERVKKWLRLQFDYVQEPGHRLFASIAGTIGSLGPEVVAEVAEQHRRLYATFDQIVADALPRAGVARDPELVAEILVGMLNAAASAVIEGTPTTVAWAELERSTGAVLGWSNREAATA